MDDHSTSSRCCEKTCVVSSKDGIEYEGGPPGSFPRIRILQSNAAESLVSLIAQDAIDSHLPGLNLQQLNTQVRDAVLSFLTNEDVSLPTFKIVEEYARRSTLWSGLLLLRGLLATDILLFTFRDQRWRVDYGLAPNRTMLAVPYRAKDVPAPKAELVAKGHIRGNARYGMLAFVLSATPIFIVLMYHRTISTMYRRSIAHN